VKAKASLIETLALAVLGAGLWAVTPGAAQTPAQNAPHTSQPPARSESRGQPVQATSDGERVFEQNCSRCHSAPQGFSTRISGTIVRHMRVRANLSQHDEQELLKYLTP
jgi:mono/diheme cytochrome c family protein